MRLIVRSWDPASISALAAIFGSLTGALASSVSTWITQKHQGRRDLLAKRIFYREQLYSDFISQSAHAMADAVQHDLQDPNNLTPAYALLSRMRLSSSTDVLASAERVIQHIINTYSEPNLTPKEIQSRVAKREDPLRENEGRYTLRKTILGDLYQNCLPIHVRVDASPELLSKLKMYVLCPPHLEIGLAQQRRNSTHWGLKFFSHTRSVWWIPG